MTLTTTFSVARCAAVARAEFLKMWASRIPLIIILAIPAGMYLFVFELYHVERIASHLRIENAFDALPLLAFTVWKTMFLQAAVLLFAAFWTTVDSQYGMIRVVCCQPITRLEYLLGRACAGTLHIASFVVAFVGSLVAWAGIYSGFRGVRVQDVLSLVPFTIELTTFVVALGAIAAAVASARRTVGSGIVAGLIAFILLALMTTIPFDVFPPRFVFMRYFFFASGELRNVFPNERDAPWVRVFSEWDFYRTVLLTPVAFVLPAAIYFWRRDIVE